MKPHLPLRTIQARARQDRSRRRDALCALAFVAGWALFTGDVLAETVRVQTSSVTIAETDYPGALAEVRFANGQGDHTADTEFPLTLDGITVEVSAILGRGGADDTITVDAPEGLIAIPRTLTIADGTAGRVLIMRLDMEGM